ncbi:MAG: HNH endonuclease [Bacteroidetes bacterium]|nr:HNH endonuclease [Bacteroidota bacterium]
MQDSLAKYLKAFQRLRVDRTHGERAPHKPILLLSVLQLSKEGRLITNRIDLSAELVTMFRSNWNVFVNTNHDCLISYPFYYLKSSGFWKLIPREGFLHVDQMGSVMKSFSKLSNAVAYAEISMDLFNLMRNPSSNEILRFCLLDTFFGKNRKPENEIHEIQQKLFEDIEQKILMESPEVYRQEVKAYLENNQEEEVFLRGSVFKREIPKIYNNTCCISGMRIDTISNISMIDACHIVPFSESYDDTITNGIALCPNLHRAFDRGLIGIDEDCRVMVSKNFKEEDTRYSIRVFEGKKIQLPKLKTYYPLMENFEWHKINVFK